MYRLSPKSEISWGVGLLLTRSDVLGNEASENRNRNSSQNKSCEVRDSQFFIEI